MKLPMKNRTLLLVPFSLTLAGCSDQDLGMFGLLIVLMVVVPKFFMVLELKVCQKWNDSLLSKILRDDDGEPRFFLHYFLLLSWMLFVFGIID